MIRCFILFGVIFFTVACSNNKSGGYEKLQDTWTDPGSGEIYQVADVDDCTHVNKKKGQIWLVIEDKNDCRVVLHFNPNKGILNAWSLEP